jgi:hypothetical protein
MHTKEEGGLQQNAQAKKFNKDRSGNEGCEIDQGRFSFTKSQPNHPSPEKWYEKKSAL